MIFLLFILIIWYFDEIMIGTCSFRWRTTFGRANWSLLRFLLCSTWCEFWCGRWCCFLYWSCALRSVWRWCGWFWVQSWTRRRSFRWRPRRECLWLWWLRSTLSSRKFWTRASNRFWTIWRKRRRDSSPESWRKWISEERSRLPSTATCSKPLPNREKSLA